MHTCTVNFWDFWQYALRLDYGAQPLPQKAPWSTIFCAMKHKKMTLSMWMTEKENNQQINVNVDNNQ
jgi:hypothetical protein